MCPICGAPLTKKEGSDELVCEYCGCQIWLGENTLWNGLIDGFESIESAETHVRTTMDADMKVIIREM